MAGTTKSFKYFIIWGGGGRGVAQRYKEAFGSTNTGKIFE